MWSAWPWVNRAAVDHRDPLPDQLQAEFRRRIDQQVPAGAREQHAAPGPGVAEIHGAAGWRVAPDRRHADAPPGPQQDQFAAAGPPFQRREPWLAERVGGSRAAPPADSA